MVGYTAYFHAAKEFLVELGRAMAVEPSLIVGAVIAGVLLAPFGLVQFTTAEEQRGR